MHPIRRIMSEQRRLSFFNMTRPFACLCLGVIFAAACVLPAFTAAGYRVTAEVKLVRTDNNQPVKDMSKSVVWLVPVDRGFAPATSSDPHARMLQKDKRFDPDLLVIPIGTYV